MFGTIAQTAASHHERLDGSGYHLGLQAAETPTHYDEAVIAALRGLVSDGDADTLVPAAIAAD